MSRFAPAVADYPRRRAYYPVLLA